MSEIAERLKLTADTLPSYGECAEDIGPDDGKVFLRRFIYDNTPGAPDSENIFRHNLAEVLNEYFERVERAIAESRGQPETHEIPEHGEVYGDWGTPPDRPICICEPKDEASGQGGWDKECPVHGDRLECNCGSHPLAPLYHSPTCPKANDRHRELGDGEPSSAPPPPCPKCGSMDKNDVRCLVPDHPHPYIDHDFCRDAWHRSGAAQEVSPVGSVQKITGPERPRCPVCGAETTCLSCKAGVEEVSPPSPELKEVLTGCAQILDVIKGEWGKSWSSWDQSIRDGITREQRRLLGEPTKE